MRGARFLVHPKGMLRCTKALGPPSPVPPQSPRLPADPTEAAQPMTTGQVQPEARVPNAAWPYVGLVLPSVGRDRLSDG